MGVENGEMHHVLKPYALANIKGYILQQKQMCSFMKISIMDARNMIHYQILSNSSPHVNAKPVLK
jgi:hypothetical protein